MLAKAGRYAPEAHMVLTVLPARLCPILHAPGL